MNTLLLIVDVQNQFIPEGKVGEEFCAAIEKLQHDYSLVAISKFINTPDSFWVKYLDWDKMMEGEKSTDLAFNPVKDVFIYKKHSKFSSCTKQLLDYIKENNIKEVHLCGADTDACVMVTAYDLWDLKIDFKVLADHCISSAGANTHSVAQQIMNKNFGFKIMKTREETNKQPDKHS